MLAFVTKFRTEVQIAKEEHDLHHHGQTGKQGSALLKFCEITKPLSSSAIDLNLADKGHVFVPERWRNDVYGRLSQVFATIRLIQATSTPAHMVAPAIWECFSGLVVM